MTFPLFPSYLCLQEEGEVASDQSLKEFEGATLRYASINLKYVLLKLYDYLYLVYCLILFLLCILISFSLCHCSYNCSQSEEEEKLAPLCTDLETKVSQSFMLKVKQTLSIKNSGIALDTEDWHQNSHMGAALWLKTALKHLGWVKCR